MVRLGLAGDVMLGRKVNDRGRARPPDAVWGDLLDRLRALDGLLVNLECTLSTRGTPWTETHRPFHFRADPEWALEALRAAGVEYCSLANNHLLDFGAPALADTLDGLDDAGIAHAGAGGDAAAAQRPAEFTVRTGEPDVADGGRDGAVGGADDGTGSLDVAAVSFTDNTPEYAAGPDEPGVAHLSGTGEESRRTVGASLSAVRRTDPDLLVASLHWGPNMVTEPDEEFREFCRRLARKGVDVVHGHSAHVFHGVEVHDGSLLCYDTGDFVDDYRVDPDLRNDRSFLFEVAVEGGAPADLRLHPVEIRDRAVHAADSEAAAWCRERMRELSAPFGTEFERAGRGLALSVG